MNGEVRYTTGKMTAGLESPTETRERMSRLAAELADESRTVFYAGWSDTRMRWVVSNDRAEMVRDCATMEALCPDWGKIKATEGYRPYENETSKETIGFGGTYGQRPEHELTMDELNALTHDLRETDRRAEEFNRVHGDEDPQVKVIRVLEYRGSQSDVLWMLKGSAVNESKGVVISGVELTELVRTREVL